MGWCYFASIGLLYDCLSVDITTNHPTWAHAIWWSLQIYFTYSTIPTKFYSPAIGYICVRCQRQNSRKSYCLPSSGQQQLFQWGAAPTITTPAKLHQSTHYAAVLVVLPTIVYIIYFSCHTSHHVHWQTIHRTKPAKGLTGPGTGKCAFPLTVLLLNNVLHPEYRWTLVEMSSAVNSFVSQHMQPIIILTTNSSHLFDVPVVGGIPDSRLWDEQTRRAHYIPRLHDYTSPFPTSFQTAWYSFHSARTNDSACGRCWWFQLLPVHSLTHTGDWWASDASWDQLAFQSRTQSVPYRVAAWGAPWGHRCFWTSYKVNYGLS